MKMKLRSAMCILLAAVLLLPGMLQVQAADEKELSVYVASDIHYKPQSSLPPLAEAVELPGDPLCAHANTKSMLTYEADAVVDEFLARFAASDADILLIPGDLSENGQWDEHLGIAQKLRDCERETGKRVFVIPGNHDIRTSASGGRLDLADFIDVYAELGYDEALARHEGTASYTAELDDHYRLLAIDPCIYRQDGSEVSDELLAWIEQQVQAADADGKKLVCMVHFSLLEHFGIEGIAMNMLCLDRHETLAEQFADWGIQYVFTGHVHGNDISSAVSKQGNPVFDIETGCLLAYPNAYRQVTFTDTAVTVKTEYIDKIDLSKLPAGYSDAQLALMETDFPAYSYRYFRAGLRGFAVDIPDGTKKLAENLKIEEGSAAYDALGEVMQILKQAVSLPLYDTGTPETDSIEELATLGGCTLAESDYADVIDIAAVLYAGHLAGDETIGFDSPEVRLLGQALKAVLIYAFTNLPVFTTNTLLAAIGITGIDFPLCDSFYTPRARLYYMQTAAARILREYIRPLANGFTDDLSAPADLNVTLPAYGGTWEPDTRTADLTLADTFASIFRALFNAFFRALRAVFLPKG